LAIIADAEALERAGCAALVVEAVPAEVSALLTSRLTIPVIGIGAGAETSGQVLVYHDLLGLGEGRLARFVRQYASGRADQVAAVRRWAHDVRARRYPNAAESYPVSAETLDEVKRRLEAKPA
jgi:Ketopantoate hydroxymethyltransferase